MPKLFNCPDTDVNKTVSNFGFSAKRPDALTGTEYTIVDLEVDVSTSVAPFSLQLTDAIKIAVTSLAKSPATDRILLRVGTFASGLDEIHGFIPLNDVIEVDSQRNVTFKDPTLYDLHVGGATALRDATVGGVEAIGTYGATLDNLDYDVNGLLIQVTDGQECASKTIRSNGAAKAKIQQILGQEKLQELKKILIGVGDPDAVGDYNRQLTFRQLLEEYRDEVGFDSLIFIGDATPENLAKMGGFISRSVSASSQALNSGGPSKTLTF